MSEPVAKVYIHELIDIIGHQRARYMHHMTANWCPVGRAERGMLCLGVWATLGSTGPWPQVVNMWELDGWGGLARNLQHETSGGRDQDPALAEWWAVAASLRRGGIDRIVTPTPWSRPVERLCADGVRGVVYAHEVVTVPTGTVGDLLDAVAAEGIGAYRSFGVEPVGAFEVAMRDRSEAILLWAIPDWQSWADFEAGWSGSGPLHAWATTLAGLGAQWQRQLLVDSELSPLRIGRQPTERDRRPLERI